ncbi:glycosyltransferase family 4 protein [Rhodobacter maris]|uniref:Glycosyltransferase involved in cell wall bisynthesis n=1 Tax=Rhodobacter maris TaxID=446682 RepID=A0A285T9S8_9RHOB|nr:glycosyltransferase family 4 protein [Rhodobacter maris]SOC18319.1 glycosyltransferase involved in cell wall bisynthesis [Rhodobacter maris]
MPAAPPCRTIAFYAPLKAPDHPVASGDRLMARQLMAALAATGAEVGLASSLRAFLPRSEDSAALDRLEAEAEAERARIAALWERAGPPDLWFCYHPYYKAPDLIGPPLAARFGLPWVSAEASLSARRNIGLWAETQERMRSALLGAGMNFALTARDAAGLSAGAPGLALMRLHPFLELEALPPPAPLAGRRIVTVAMMRAGDKMESYRALAQALAELPVGADWALTVVGDGPMRAEVEALLPPGRVRFIGALPPEGVRAELAAADVYLWPGCGEAYGLAYLEAQAAGLPVVGWATAGVPEVVAAGETGLLSPPGDVAALAHDLARLLDDSTLKRQMGAAARARVLARHARPRAVADLARGLACAMKGKENADG